MSILKNVAGQSLYAVLVNAADGSPATSGATVAVNGTAGTGTLTHLGGGLWQYALAQAETNYNSFGYVFAGTGVIPVGGMVVTQDYPRNAIPAVGAGSSGGLPLAGSGGKVAATVATGDGADAAAAKATLGTAGAGLTALGDTRLAHLDADVSSRSTLDAAGARTAVGLASANLDTQLSGISGKTANIPADPASATDISTLQTHGDSAWKTATGFSTFNPASDVVAHVTLVDTCTANTDMRGTDNALLAGNYTPPPSLAQVVAGVWDEPKANHTTAGTYGLYLDAAVSGVSTGGVSASDIATAVWQDLLTGADFATAGSVGSLVKTNLDAKVSTAGGNSSDPWSVVLPGSYAEGTAGAILGNTLAANIVSVAGTAVTGPAPMPTVTGGKVAATVATGDGADAASVKATVDANLDAQVSTRLAASAYTSPPSGATVAQAVLTAKPTPRDVSSVTDPTVADCLVAAFVEAAGNEAVSGTAYTKLQPDNASTFVTTTLDNADTPTSRTR